MTAFITILLIRAEVQGGVMFWGIKKIFALVFLLAFTIKVSAIEFVPGEYVVQFNDSNSIRMTTNRLVKDFGAKLKRVIPNSNIAVYIMNKDIPHKKVISELSEFSTIKFIEPNYIYRINRMPNDPQISKLWGLINSGQEDSSKNLGIAGIDIGAEKAWDIQTGNQELVVAVIDTGVDYTHSDLKGNIWTNEAELNGKPKVDDDQNGFIDDIHGYDFANKDGDPMDDHGHGSHCSGTIGAKGNDNSGIVGVAWNVKIMGVKFLTREGSGTLENAVEGIKYATKMGAKIMSNSWGGGGFSEILKTAIEDANAHGIIFTAAAGNDSNNNDTTPSYPSSYQIPNVISVAAVDNKGLLASFSNFGRNVVHVAAPGVNVFSSIPGGYDSWSGTSMATPHVTGVVALLLSQEPTLTPEDVKTRLIRTSKPVSYLKSKVKSRGLVDAFLALTNQESPPDLNDPENWGNYQNVSIATSHPYGKNEKQTWEVEVPDANEIAIFFESFDTEVKYDKVTFYDRSGVVLGELTGNLGQTWSPTIKGNYVKIFFTSDDSVQKQGFVITKAAYRKNQTFSLKQ